MASLQVGHDINAKVRTADVSLEKNVSFKDLFLSENVLSGLNKAGFHRPSPIQLNAIPFGRCGLDLIVQAKSGTGKTCVFSVIALEAVVTSTSALQAIILAPTREIAVQISSVLEAVGQCIKDLAVTCFIGGRPVSEDKVNAKGCHIAVGTPGRIFQLLQLGVLSCENVRLFVLDEADKLLEHNFQSQINSIYSILPINKQMVAASATYPEELAQFVTKYMQDPTFVRLNPKDMALLGIKQYIHEIPRPVDKYLSDFEYKIKATVNLLEAYTFTQALVFSNYHSHAKDLSDACNSVGLSATFISGNLAQTKRLEAIQLLKEYKCKVLISTDLTSRGIDASNVDLVVNLDVPHDWETYMHRTGRAGRFGSLGAVISVVLAGSETAELLKITEACNIPVFPIACVDGTISLSTPPMSNESFKRGHDAFCGSIMGDNGKDGDRILQEELTPNTEIVDFSSDASSTAIGNKNDAQKMQHPKILSLPELMHKNEAQPKRPCFLYDTLLDSYSVFKDHGELREIEQIMTFNEEPRKIDGDGLDGESKASVIPNVFPLHKSANNHQNGYIPDDTEGNNGPHCRQEAKTHSNCGVEVAAHCTRAGAKSKGVSLQSPHTNKSVVPRAIPKEDSCTNWANTDEAHATKPNTNTSRKKTSNARRNEIIPRNKEKRHIRREYQSQHSLCTHDSVPMLLPRCSDSLNIVRPGDDCANCYCSRGRQLVWKWHSYYFMHWMWWNQYLYVQSWRSRT